MLRLWVLVSKVASEPSRAAPAARGRALAAVGLVAAVIAGLEVGCLQIAGVQGFEKSTCDGPCDGGPEAEVPSKCPSGMAFVGGGAYTPSSGAGTVTIGDLCVDTTEVTVRAYTACVLAGTCTPPPSKTFCNYGVAGRDDDPMNCVDVAQAKAFCARLGRRLPTEDEWEWVARGDRAGFDYPWGNTLPSASDAPERLCWQAKTRHDDETVWPSRPAGTCVVGSFPAGGHDSIVDLAGNVWEWTSTAVGASFVFRGGSAFDTADAATMKVTARRVAASATGYSGVGFRCFAAP